MPFCAFCGVEVRPTGLACGGCGAFIQKGGVVNQSPQENPPQPLEQEQRVITEFVPTREERIVRCRICNGENKRGECYCVHCGRVLIPKSDHDEVVDIDKKTVRKIPPRQQVLNLKIACQLYALKLINKLEPYPCNNIIELQDGERVECKQKIDISMERCPRCQQKNDVFYNCKNAKLQGVNCDQRITLDMMYCPKCEAIHRSGKNIDSSTLVNDLISIVGGMTFGEEIISFVDNNLQQDFIQFKLVKQTFPVVIAHDRVSTIKTDLESWCNRLSEVLSMLAMFLDIATGKKGSSGMQSIFQSFNPFLFMQGNGPSAPVPSDDLNQLIDQRQAEIQQGNVAEAAGDAGDEEDEEEEDDGYQFSV
jgi:hypothetical protein